MPQRDALFVASHSWALATASPLTVTSLADQSVAATARFATPAALAAMKLHAIQTRSSGGSYKRAADARDIYRLLVDLDTDGAVRTALAASPSDLRALVRAAATRILLDEANRTRAWLAQGDHVMASVSVEQLRYVGAALVGALE